MWLTIRFVRLGWCEPETEKFYFDNKRFKLSPDFENMKEKQNNLKTITVNTTSVSEPTWAKVGLAAEPSAGFSFSSPAGG